VLEDEGAGRVIAETPAAARECGDEEADDVEGKGVEQAKGIPNR